MSGPALAPVLGDDFQALALRKMTAVLGAARAEQIMEILAAQVELPLRTADDLFRFAAALSCLGGFEGAVGAMLSVSAVMRGARGD